MKRFLALLLLVAAPLSAQLVDSNHLKRKTNGGIVGDSVNANYVAPYSGTSAPGTPQTNQLWWDTNTTPARLKRYDGSAWQTISDDAVATQADFSSFPGSPVNGQVFFAISPPELCIYETTNSKWWCFAAAGSQTGANVADNFTGTVITAPAPGMTIADGGITGNMASGLHSCKVTFANSTGGETTMSPVTTSVTFTAAHKITYASIPTGGTGTTQRRIYCSKAAQDVSGPWYWIYTVADNSTTTVTADNGLADANLIRHGPKSNYSAPLSGIWTVENKTTATTSGGCGSTGSALACSASSANVANMGSGPTTDPTIRAYTDLTAYNSGDYTLQYRVKFVSITGDTADGNVVSPCVGTVRVGTADDSRAVTACMGDVSSSNWTSPLSGSNPVAMNWSHRGTVAASHRGGFGQTFAWPRALTTVWIRWVKKGNYGNWFVSSNLRDWSPVKMNNNQNSTEANWAVDISAMNPTRFELELYINSNTSVMYYVEIDTFTITVN